jgi:PTH2 family peptidyl-tRNA hydrolase
VSQSDQNLPAAAASPQSLVVKRAGQKLIIVMNQGIKMTRGKYAAQAVHAALLACGAHPETPVVVIGGSHSEITEMPLQIQDAGRTELPRGTITAGAVWIGEDERFQGHRVTATGKGETS